MINLGSCYFYGLNGVDADKEEAVKWLKKAVDLGDTEACKWFRKAMHAGNGLGAYNLALMYYDGSGVDKDEDKAIRIMRKASELGESLADDWLETNT